MRISTGCRAVDEMAGISIKGNVIPPAWYRSITRPNGKPYLVAIVILSDIVYWYRPTEIRDEATGALVGYRKRFKGDMLQRSYGQLSEQFGISKKEATSAITQLEGMGIIKRHFRTIEVAGVKMNNVLFIELMPKSLAAATFGDTYHPEKIEGVPPKSDRVSPQKAIGAPPKGDTNTEITTKITTKSNDTPHTAQRAAGECVEAIASLWSVYPKKQGGNPEKKKAASAYAKAISEGATPEQIERGVIAYSAYCKAQGIETRYIKRLSAFIADGLYMDDYATGGRENLSEVLKQGTGGGFTNEADKQAAAALQARLRDKYAKPQPLYAECPRCGAIGRHIGGTSYECPRCSVGFSRDANAR